jgi:hypothetical protein
MASVLAGNVSASDRKDYFALEYSKLYDANTSNLCEKYNQLNYYRAHETVMQLRQAPHDVYSCCIVHQLIYKILYLFSWKITFSGLLRRRAAWRFARSQCQCYRTKNTNANATSNCNFSSYESNTVRS